MMMRTNGCKIILPIKTMQQWIQLIKHKWLINKKTKPKYQHNKNSSNQLNKKHKIRVNKTNQSNRFNQFSMLSKDIWFTLITNGSKNGRSSWICQTFAHALVILITKLWISERRWSNRTTAYKVFRSSTLMRISYSNICRNSASKAFSQRCQRSLWQHTKVTILLIHGSSATCGVWSSCLPKSTVSTTIVDSNFSQSIHTKVKIKHERNINITILHVRLIHLFV